MSYRVYETPALVVSRWPYGEANFRHLLYTRDLGRIYATAQSVRKVASKLAPALQVGSQSNISLVCGKSGWRLVGAAPQQNFLLATPIAKQAVIERFLRLLTYLVPDQQVDQELYEIVSAGLKAVTASQSMQDIKANERLLVLRSLVQLGYAPSPEAPELEPFIRGFNYTDEVVTAFIPLAGKAVQQINESLKTIQL